MNHRDIEYKYKIGETAYIINPDMSVSTGFIAEVRLACTITSGSIKTSVNYKICREFTLKELEKFSKYLEPMTRVEKPSLGTVYQDDMITTKEELDRQLL